MFTRFVEPGRICLINYGEYAGKLVVVVDILDQNRILVEGPTSGVRRTVLNVKRVALTALKIQIKRGEEKGEVEKAYKGADIDTKFAESRWGRKLAKRKKRAQLDDFGRFKVICARMKRARLINAQLEKLKSSA